MKLHIRSLHVLQPPRAAPRAAFYLLLFFLLFEYLRLHDVLPILKTIKVQTAVLAMLLLIVIAETGKGGVRLTRQDWLLLGFLGLASFTILTSTNNYYAYLYAYDLGLMLIGYFAITHILLNEADVKIFLSLLVGIHVYLATSVILGYEHTGFDAQGYLTGFTAGSNFLGDENDVALAMIVILPMVIYLFRQASSQGARLLWGIGSVIILLSIIFTYSRGGFIGLAALLLFWAVTSRNKVKAIGILLVALMLVVAVAPPGYWQRIETIQDTQSGTAQQRRDLWSAARRMFRDSPVWGVGGHNYGVLLPHYGLEFPDTRRPNLWGKAVHSLYFQLLAEFGLLGVLLIGSVILLNSRDLRTILSLSRDGGCSRPLGHLAEALRGSWLGLLVAAAFVSVLTYPHLYYLTALTVVVRRLASLEDGQVEVEPVGVLEGVA